MKIKIREDSESKFSDDDRKWVELLEEDHFFDDFVTDLRKRAHIPQQGFSDPNEQRNLSIDDKKTIFERVELILSVYKQNAIYWTSTITAIVLYGIATPPSNQKHPPIEIHGFYSEVHLIIREASSVEDVINFLKENRAVLTDAMTHVPKPKRVKIDQVDIMKDVITHEKAGDKPKAVAKFIEKEYEDKLLFTPTAKIIGDKKRRFMKDVDKLSGADPLTKDRLEKSFDKE